MNLQTEILDRLILDLVEPNIPLSQSLLKAKIIAYSIENAKLQNWIESEINGYVGQTNLPSYRIIGSPPVADMIQDDGFGNYATRNNYRLPIENVPAIINDERMREYLLNVRLHMNIAELESMLLSGKDYQQPLAEFVKPLFKFTNNWVIDSAYQKIPSNALFGVVNKIKSNLLDFLLKLKQELGQINNLTFMENKDKINQIFDKTIGKIEGTNINITIGDNNNSLSGLNQGNDSNLNVIRGNDNSIDSKAAKLDELKNFINTLKEELLNVTINEDDKLDITSEIQRIDNQCSRESPKYDIIGSGLNTIKNILQNIPANIAANILTPSVWEQLTMLASFFTS